MHVLLKPLPDELLYSVLARTAYHYGYLSPKQFLQVMFGSSGVLAVPDLPSNLNALAWASGEVWTLNLNKLALSHTLAGYYTHFHGERRRQEVFAQMGGRGSGLQVRLGVCAGSARSPSRFHMCTRCWAEDMRQYGQSYWHRSHQLPGVLVCDRHGDALLESAVPFRPPGRHEYVAAPMDVHFDDLHSLARALERPAIAQAVAKRSVALMNGPARAEETLPDYRMVLGVCGFDAGRGGVARLRDEFRATFGDDLLAASFRTRPGRDSLQWLDEVLRAPRRAMHPYKHVLMRVFVDEHLGVNRGPHDKSQSLVDTRQRRWGLYRDPELRKEAAALVRHGLRTHSIARALDVDWKTAFRLLAPLPRRVTVDTRDHDIDRNAWMTLAQGNIGAGKKVLRRQSPALYARLYRNDRQWLLAFGPKMVPPQESRARVDWEARDAELETMVHSQVALVLAEVPMRRASRSHVLGTLGSRALLAHKAAKLPRTYSALTRLCESVEEFQVRRLVAIIAPEAMGSLIPDAKALREAHIAPARLKDGGARLLSLARAQALGAALSAGGSSHAC